MLDYFTVNKREYELLHGYPYLVQLLYSRGLKSQMNPATYRMKGVTWNTITADLEVHPRPGIKAYRPDSRDCKRALQHLIKLGLIVSESEGVRLKIYFPMAERYESVLNKAARVAARVAAPIAARKNYSQAVGFEWDLTILDGKAALIPDPIPAPIPASSNKDLTYTYTSTCTYSDFEKFDGVLSVDQWKGFFVAGYGFSEKAVLMPTCVAMFEDWVRRGIDTEIAKNAVLMAAERLGKPIPDNPSYYRTLVDDLVMARNRYSSSSIANPAGISLFAVNGETLVAASGEDQAGKYFRKVSGFDVSHIELVPENEVISVNISGEERRMGARSLVDTWVSQGKSVPGIVMENQ